MKGNLSSGLGSCAEALGLVNDWTLGLKEKQNNALNCIYQVYALSGHVWSCMKYTSP